MVEPANASVGLLTRPPPRVIVVVSGLLLMVDLLFLPWHHYALDVDTGGLDIQLPTFSLDRTGVQSPRAALGIAAAVVAAAMVGLVLLAMFRRLSPRLERVHCYAGSAALGLLIAKALAADYLGLGAWLGLLMASALAYGGLRLSQELEPDR